MKVLGLQKIYMKKYLRLMEYLVQRLMLILRSLEINISRIKRNIKELFIKAKINL